MDARECGEQMVFGNNGSQFAVNHSVQDELTEAKLGTELGLQLCEGGDVLLNTSTVSVGPVGKGSDLTIVRGVDNVGCEGRHFWQLKDWC